MLKPQEIWEPASYQRHGAFVAELAGEVVAWLDARSGERILDLGCGDGRLTAALAATGATVLGLDRSAAMAAAAAGRGCAAVVALAEALPFAPATFDAVFSNAALHWVRDTDAMLTAVERALRPGGRFVAECGGHGNIAAIRVAFTAVLQRHGYGHIQGDSNYYPSQEEFSRRLSQHGFDVERIELVARPTRLESGGMMGWLETFRRGVLQALPAEMRPRIVEETAALLAPALRDAAGNWWADYVRLRFRAWRRRS